MFDEFVVKACGFYCQASCKRGRGFPSVILNQWKSCTSVPSVHVVLPSSDDVNDPDTVVDISVGPSGLNNTVSVIDQTLPPSDVNGTQFVMVRKLQRNRVFQKLDENGNNGNIGIKGFTTCKQKITVIKCYPK